MDSTELHYLAFDPDAVWEEMMINYIRAGGDTLYPGDEKYMLLRGVQADIIQAFAGVDNGLRMATLRYAVGEYLDALGENRGCARIEAAKARASVTIQTKATGTASSLPAGTSMTADGEIFYLLDSELLLSGDSEMLTASVTADRTGSAGNGLASGTQMHLAVAQAAVQSVVAASDASGGENREDDESYRERIRTWGITKSVNGTAGQYESLAMAVSGEIEDANAVNTAAGTVVVYLLIPNAGERAAIVSAVTARLNEADTRILGIQVSAAAATAVTYTLTAQVTVDVGAQKSADFQAAAADYQAWQDGAIGRAFNPDRLMAALYQAGASRVVWKEGSEFDGGEIEYTEIAADKYCSGAVAVEVTVA